MQWRFAAHTAQGNAIHRRSEEMRADRTSPADDEGSNGAPDQISANSQIPALIAQSRCRAARNFAIIFAARTHKEH
jgi:hypothetical protein